MGQHRHNLAARCFLAANILASPEVAVTDNQAGKRFGEGHTATESPPGRNSWRKSGALWPQGRRYPPQ